VRIFNYSDADVNAASVILQHSLLPDTSYGSYPGPVSIQNQQDVRLIGDFTIPTTNITAGRMAAHQDWAWTTRTATATQFTALVELIETP